MRGKIMTQEFDTLSLVNALRQRWLENQNYIFTEKQAHLLQSAYPSLEVKTLSAPKAGSPIKPDERTESEGPDYSGASSQDK